MVFEHLFICIDSIFKMTFEIFVSLVMELLNICTYAYMTIQLSFKCILLLCPRTLIFWSLYYTIHNSFSFKTESAPGNRSHKVCLFSKADCRAANLILSSIPWDSFLSALELILSVVLDVMHKSFDFLHCSCLFSGT